MEKDDKKSDKDDKDGKDKLKSCKALFVQRLVAYIIDVLIISFIASLITLPFFDVEESDKLNEKANNLVIEYSNNEINTKAFTYEYMDLSYKLARSNGLVSIITVVLEIIYFVVFQIYNNGQTLGKKLMKIKVISSNGELSMNQMIVRSLIANSVLFEIIAFILMLIEVRTVYFYGICIFGIIQYAVTIISIFMVMYREDGCSIHDKIAHTEVIRI